MLYFLLALSVLQTVLLVALIQYRRVGATPQASQTHSDTGPIPDSFPPSTLLLKDRKNQLRHTITIHRAEIPEVYEYGGTLYERSHQLRGGPYVYREQLSGR